MRRPTERGPGQAVGLVYEPTNILAVLPTVAMTAPAASYLKYTETLLRQQVSPSWGSSRTWDRSSPKLRSSLRR